MLQPFCTLLNSGLLAQVGVSAWAGALSASGATASPVTVAIPAIVLVMRFIVPPQGLSVCAPSRGRDVTDVSAERNLSGRRRRALAWLLPPGSGTPIPTCGAGSCPA